MDKDKKDKKTEKNEKPGKTEVEKKHAISKDAKKIAESLKKKQDESSEMYVEESLGEIATEGAEDVGMTPQSVEELLSESAFEAKRDSEISMDMPISDRNLPIEPAVMKPINLPKQESLDGSGSSFLLMGKDEFSDAISPSSNVLKKSIELEEEEDSSDQNRQGPAKKNRKSQTIFTGSKGSGSIVWKEGERWGLNLMPATILLLGLGLFVATFVMVYYVVQYKENQEARLSYEKQIGELKAEQQNKKSELLDYEQEKKRMEEERLLNNRRISSLEEDKKIMQEANKKFQESLQIIQQGLTDMERTQGQFLEKIDQKYKFHVIKSPDQFPEAVVYSSSEIGTIVFCPTTKNRNNSFKLPMIGNMFVLGLEASSKEDLKDKINARKKMESAKFLSLMNSKLKQDASLQKKFDNIYNLSSKIINDSIKDVRAYAVFESNIELQKSILTDLVSFGEDALLLFINLALYNKALRELIPYEEKKK